MTPIGSAVHPTPQTSVESKITTKPLFGIRDPLTRKKVPARTQNWSHVRTTQRVVTTISTSSTDSSQPLSLVDQPTQPRAAPHFATPMLLATATDSETWHTSHPVPVASTSAEPSASSSTQQSTSPAPQPSAVAGTSGVQSGYSSLENKQFQCNTCQHVANTKQNMETHLRKHTGERPFQCQHCDYAAAQKPALTRHERTHTGEKPFHCQYCDKSFSNQYNKNVHERIHTGERPFQCQLCDFVAAQNNGLKYHMRTKHQSQQAASVPDQPPAKKTKTK